MKPSTSISAVSVLLLLAILLPTEDSSAASSFELTTAHYDIGMETGDPKEIGRLVEQLHAKLTRFFGGAPNQRLRIKIFATHESYRRGLDADGELNPTSGEAGGCYAPGRRTAYLWDGGSPDALRGAIIHECTHQFHWLTHTGNSGPSSHYLEEGLAEYITMHRWDGHTLEVANAPAFARCETASKVRDRFDRVWHGELRRIATCAETVPWGAYEDAWGLVAFLIDLDREMFFTWARKLDRRTDPVAAWDSTFGRFGPAINERYRGWLAHQEGPWDMVTGTSDAPYPWQIVFGTSKASGETIECRPGYKSFAIALLKEQARRMFTVAELDRGATAGIVFGYQSAREFSMIRFNERLEVELVPVQA